MCFAATNRAVRIIFVASAFDVVEAYTADGERAVTGTGPFFIFIPNSITLVRGREGTSAVVTVLIPAGQGEGGGVEDGPHQTLSSERFRSSQKRRRFVMLHSHVLLQSLFRGCFVLTKVTFWHQNGIHSIFINLSRGTLLFLELLSTLGISPKC